MPKTIFWLVLFICLLLVLATYFGTMLKNQKEILTAKNEMEQTRALRDSLLSRISSRDTMINNLEDMNGNLKIEIDHLRSEKESLENERRQAEAAVFRLFQPEEYINKFNEFYPEFSRSGWGFREIFNEQYKVEIEYFLIPTQFTSAFLQDHIDAVSYRQQVDKLTRVDDLNQLVIVYKDSIINLERENKLAYKNGYDDAYTKYEELNQKYVRLLENPQLKLGYPAAAATIIGSVGVGFLLGSMGR